MPELKFGLDTEWSGELVKILHWRTAGLALRGGKIILAMKT